MPNLQESYGNTMEEKNVIQYNFRAQSKQRVSCGDQQRIGNGAHLCATEQKY